MNASYCIVHNHAALSVRSEAGLMLLDYIV